MMIAAERILASEKRRSFTGHSARRLLCFAGLVVALMLVALSRTHHFPKKAASGSYSAVSTFGEGRKIYPLSVIHGGAYSAEELNRARRLDSVVRAHYADFGRNPVVKQTPTNLFMYVSYRKSDKVYWTRTKRRIPRGESVLSDGENLARARCGNRLSFTPRQPTSPEKETSEEAFNTPEIPKVLVPFDAPPPPAADADLYVPANPLLTDSFSPLPPSFPFAASHPAASPWSGEAYAPMPAAAAGSPWGGAPFFGGGVGPSRGGIIPSSRNGSIALGTPFAVPVMLDTPEPATIKMLLIPILIFALFSLRGRIHSR